MSQTPDTVHSRVSDSSLERSADPGVISQGQTQRHEEEVEEVVVTSEHDDDHQEDLVEEAELSESRAGREEEEGEGDLNDEGGDNTQLVHPLKRENTEL